MILDIKITLDKWGGFCKFEGECFNDDYYESGDYDYKIKVNNVDNNYITYIIPTKKRLLDYPDERGKSTV